MEKAALEGSEKQVRWAEEIRERLLHEAEEALATGRESATRAVEKGLKTQAEVDEVLARHEKGLARMYKVKAAGWWIAQRIHTGRNIMAILADPTVKITW